MPFFGAPRPRIFAHRGAAGRAPENTLAAFDLGIADGADGLELDVHLSADGVVVVCHDRTLERTTDASGPIASRTAAELAKVDAGFWFRDSRGAYPFRGQGVGVPTLREVLRRYRDVSMIVEMKGSDPALGLAVAAEVAAASAVDRVCLASNSCRIMQRARAASIGASTGACRWEVRLALYRSWVGWPVRDRPYGGYQVPETSGPTRIVTPRFIGHAHEAGLEVQVWTIDAEPDMERLFQWGVDGIITNYPARAVVVREGTSARSCLSRQF